MPAGTRVQSWIGMAGTSATGPAGIIPAGPVAEVTSSPPVPESLPAAVRRGARFGRLGAPANRLPIRQQEQQSPHEVDASGGQHGAGNPSPCAQGKDGETERRLFENGGD